MAKKSDDEDKKEKKGFAPVKTQHFLIYLIADSTGTTQISGLKKKMEIPSVNVVK
jgi:hypothetical protein